MWPCSGPRCCPWRPSSACPGRSRPCASACVAAVADETPGGSGSDQVLDEVSCALVVSRRSAAHTRATAETLRHQPEVWAALARGDLDLTRARILADALLEIPATDPDGRPREDYDTECAALLGDGLAYAQDHTARRLELFLHRRLLALGCGERPRRRARGLAERGVWIGHRGDGTADLVARLASEDAERVYSVIRACALADRNGDPTQQRCRSPRTVGPLARRRPGRPDPRPPDQRQRRRTRVAIQTARAGPPPAGRHRHHGHHPHRLPGRPHRRTRSHQRIRGDPRRRRPPAGRWRRPLATRPDQPHHRRRPRRRDPVLPAPRSTRPARPTARRDLPIPRLRGPGSRVRPRPPHPLPPRTNLRRRTSMPCADATTASNTTAGGTSKRHPTAGCAGPAPKAHAPPHTPTTTTPASPERVTQA